MLSVFLDDARSNVTKFVVITALGNWTVPDTTALSVKPESRMGHTTVYDPTVRSLYLFGGSKNRKWFNDIHVLDVDEWKWQLIKVFYYL